MNLNFLNTALVGLILSASCLVNVAKAGIIIQNTSSEPRVFVDNTASEETSWAYAFAGDANRKDFGSEDDIVAPASISRVLYVDNGLDYGSRNPLAQLRVSTSYSYSFIVNSLDNEEAYVDLNINIFLALLYQDLSDPLVPSVEVNKKSVYGFSQIWGTFSGIQHQVVYNASGVEIETYKGTWGKNYDASFEVGKEYTIGLISYASMRACRGCSGYMETFADPKISFTNPIDADRFNLTIDKLTSPVMVEVGNNRYESTTSVPEPSTLAIFALGLMGIASRRFKKQS